MTRVRRNAEFWKISSGRNGGRSSKFVIDCHLKKSPQIKASADLFESSEYQKKFNTIEEANKALVLEAFETLFNQRDYGAAERFWSPKYIQHRALIEPGPRGVV